MLYEKTSFAWLSALRIVTVRRVVDGDTVEILPSIDGIKVVRLIGVDTPETHFVTAPEPYAEQAPRFTSDNLSGRQVALEFDAERTDQYGRLLAYVHMLRKRCSMFNETLVRQGYARVATFPPNVRYTNRFLAAQRIARAEAVGLWDSQQNCSSD